jgi:hypothetical protein
MPFRPDGRVQGVGILRLRMTSTSWASCFAQDDKSEAAPQHDWKSCPSRFLFSRLSVQFWTALPFRERYDRATSKRLGSSEGDGLFRGQAWVSVGRWLHSTLTPALFFAALALSLSHTSRKARSKATEWGVRPTRASSGRPPFGRSPRAYCDAKNASRRGGSMGPSADKKRPPQDDRAFMGAPGVRPRGRRFPVRSLLDNLRRCRLGL